MKKGITLFGEIGAGKNYIAKIFSEKMGDIKIVNLGDICREIMENVAFAKNMDIDATRALGQNVGSKLREIDVNLLNDYARGKMKKNNDEVMVRTIIVGGRTREDLDYWKKQGYLILGVKSTKSKEMSIKRDGSEFEYARNHTTEIQVNEIIELGLCDQVIENEHNHALLNKEIELIIKRYF